MSGKFALESCGVWATNLHVAEGGMVHSKWLGFVVVELCVVLVRLTLVPMQR